MCKQNDSGIDGQFILVNKQIWFNCLLLKHSVANISCYSAGRQLGPALKFYTIGCSSTNNNTLQAMQRTIGPLHLRRWAEEYFYRFYYWIRNCLPFLSKRVHPRFQWGSCCSNFSILYNIYHCFPYYPFYPLANEVAKGYSNATVRPP